MADASGDVLNPISDFDDKFQRAIVGHMMRDRGFRLMVFSQEIKYEHFRDPYVAAIASKMMKEANNEVLGGPIGPELMFQYLREDYKDDRDRIKCNAAVNDCAHAALELKIEAVTQKMTGWMQLLRLKEMILKATAMINKRDFDNALSYSQSVIRALTQIDFTPESKATVMFRDTVNFILKQEENRFKNNCTTGSPEFDELLLRGAQVQTHELNDHIKELVMVKGKPYPMAKLTRGSLAPGDATILLGPSNAGKTTIICTLVAMNILMGKDVLLIVHEQHADDIKTKLLQAMMFMDNATLTGTAKGNPALIQFYEYMINRHLCYVHYIRAGQMNVEAVGGIIEVKQDKWKADHNGKGFDLMVNDYPGKLRARSLDHRVNIKKHEEMAFVYDYLINLGREHKFHSFLAMQTNREGYKAAQGSNGETRIVDQGDAGESFSPMQLADNVITINRGDEDKINHRIRLYIGKSRKAQTGSIFVSKTDMTRSRAYGPSVCVESDAQGNKVNRSLPSFSCENKLKKDEFNKLCAERFGQQILLNSQMEHGKAAVDSAVKQPSQTADQFLTQLQDAEKTIAKPVV